MMNNKYKRNPHMTEPVLLQPDPSTLVVSFHPRHGEGDAVSMRFTDHATGQRYIFAAAPETTDYLAALFTTATRSQRVRFEADQLVSRVIN